MSEHGSDSDSSGGEGLDGLVSDPVLQATASQAVDSLLRIARDTNGWEFAADEKEIMITTKLLDAESGKMIIRGKGNVPGTVTQVCDLLWPLENRAVWDKFFSSKYAVQQVDLKTRIVHAFLDFGAVVSDRDFCLLERFDKKGDEVFIISSVSIDHVNAPHRAGVVRAVMRNYGFIVEPSSDYDDTCDVTYVADMDLGGSIPAMAANSFLQQMPLSIDSLRKVISAKARPTFTEVWSVTEDTVDGIAETMIRDVTLLANEITGWEHVKEEQGVKISQRHVDDCPFLAVRGTAWISADPKDLFKLLWPVEHMRTWDPHCTFADVVKVFSSKALLSHVCYEPFEYFADPRDYSLIRSFAILEDKTLVVAWRSVDSELVPHKDDHIRGQTLRGGFVIRPRSGGKSSLITMLSHTDPKGIMPVSYANYFATQRALVLASVRKAVAVPLP